LEISCPITTGAIEALAPTTKVVFLSAHLDINLLAECFAYGASGYLLEDLSPEALQKSLTLVSIGEKVFPSALALVLASSTRDDIADNRDLDKCRCLDTRECRKIEDGIAIRTDAHIVGHVSKADLSQLLQDPFLADRQALYLLPYDPRRVDICAAILAFRPRSAT
jgi:DNA-binding NarL/FixJ family response regulator